MSNSGSKLTDQDIMKDMLITEKYACSTCNTAVTESANPQVLQAMQQIEQNKQQHVHQIFTQMQQRGWYKTTPAQPGS
ncbi:MAG: spore coat protein [Methylocystaceae bacterium]